MYLRLLIPLSVLFASTVSSAQPIPELLGHYENQEAKSVEVDFSSSYATINHLAIITVRVLNPGTVVDTMTDIEYPHDGYLYATLMRDGTVLANTGASFTIPGYDLESASFEGWTSEDILSGPMTLALRWLMVGTTLQFPVVEVCMAEATVVTLDVMGMVGAETSSWSEVKALWK